MYLALYSLAMKCEMISVRIFLARGESELSLGFGPFYLERDTCATGWVTAKYSARTSIILKQGCGDGCFSICVHELDSWWGI